MCDWSDWTFLCEGRYDIALAILMGVAILTVLFLVLMSYVKRRSVHTANDEAEFIKLKQLYERGEINADQLLNRCGTLPKGQSLEGLEGIWKASR
jgi:hypothetical protein